MNTIVFLYPIVGVFAHVYYKERFFKDKNDLDKFYYFIELLISVYGWPFFVFKDILNNPTLNKSDEFFKKD